MPIKIGSSSLSNLRVGNTAVSAVFLGDLSLLSAAIAIIQQPQNTAVSGTSASFSVLAEAGDGSELSYQWEKEVFTNDLATWTQVTLPEAAHTYAAVAYGNGTFVAISSGTPAATSTDGINWTARTLPVDANWYSVAYGNGTFVAVGYSSNIAATSSSGSFWTQRTLPTSTGWYSVTFGNGIFVAVAGFDDVAATSTDGISWTQGTLPAIALWFSVTYGNGLFVAVAHNNNIAATSPDGINWTQRTLPATAEWRSVTYGNGLFVAVAGHSNIAATSPDGINWTQRTLPVTAAWYSITYGNGLFVVVPMAEVNGDVVAFSTDGINWTQQTLPSVNFWASVTYGNEIFVAVTLTGYAAASNSTSLQFFPLSGKTSNTLALTGLTESDNGTRYRVIVDSPTAVEPVTSNAATLSVTSNEQGTLHGTQTYLFDQRGEGTLHGTQTYLFDQRGEGSLYATDADGITPGLGFVLVTQTSSDVAGIYTYAGTYQDKPYYVRNPATQAQGGVFAYLYWADSQPAVDAGILLSDAWYIGKNLGALPTYTPDAQVHFWTNRFATTDATPPEQPPSTAWSSLSGGPEPSGNMVSLTVP